MQKYGQGKIQNISRSKIVEKRVFLFVSEWRFIVENVMKGIKESVIQ